MARNSKYLEGKAANLQIALQFFMKGNNDRTLAFLDQIDFWDWEVEELLFSFKNFDERAAAFETTNPGSLALDRGLMISAKIAHNAKSDRRWNVRQAQYRPEKSKVEAPTDMLQQLLNTWEELLEKAEKLLMTDKMLKTVTASGATGFADSVNNLSKYRKPQLEN